MDIKKLKQNHGQLINHLEEPDIPLVTTSQHILNQIQSILSGILGYHLYNRYPGDGKRYALLYSDPLEDLLPEFMGLIIHYRKEGQKSGKREKTIYIESNCGITFLKFMQANSIGICKTIVYRHKFEVSQKISL